MSMISNCMFLIFFVLVARVQCADTHYTARLLSENCFFLRCCDLDMHEDPLNKRKG